MAKKLIAATAEGLYHNLIWYSVVSPMLGVVAGWWASGQTHDVNPGNSGVAALSSLPPAAVGLIVFLLCVLGGIAFGSLTKLSETDERRVIASATKGSSAINVIGDGNKVDSRVERQSRR